MVDDTLEAEIAGPGWIYPWRPRDHYEIPADRLESTGKVMSLVPNRATLVQTAHMAGLADVEFAVARDDHNPRPRRDLRELILRTRLRRSRRPLASRRRRRSRARPRCS